PVLSLAAVRTSSGMVACPLLVSVAKAMRYSFHSYIIDYCKDYRACRQVPAGRKILFDNSPVHRRTHRSARRRTYDGRRMAVFARAVKAMSWKTRGTDTA